MTASARPAPDQVLVVVPARDERRRVRDCVTSVLASLAAADLARCTVVVVDDASSDGTGLVARAALAHADDDIAGAVVRGRFGLAATARTAGIEHGAAHHDPARTWLLSTDADSVVPRDWVGRHLAHARAGAVAVAGVVTLLDDPDGRRARPAWEPQYTAAFHPDGDHPHVHAANLGIRLDVHIEAGGFAPLPHGEEVELWRRLRERGHDPVADRSVAVATSGRLVGRCRDGFAENLARLAATGTPA